MSSAVDSVSATNDFSFSVEGFLSKGGSVIIRDKRSQDQLRTRGYGELIGSNYVLKPFEVLYLIHGKRLNISKKGQLVDFDSILRISLKSDRQILTKFLIYRDLRSRGYVAKEGFGFGADFRVYERGTYEKKAARYVVFGINEGTNTKLSSFSKSISDIGIMGKDAIVAVVERRGEVIYYKIDKVNFSQNKNFKSPEGQGPLAT
jgi:tRNA-intron endonuclease, archaea type